MNTDIFPPNTSEGSSSPLACSGPICYCSGYKYQLQSSWWIITPLNGLSAEIPNYIKLEPSGKLTIFAGYAWDGASAAFDTRDFMRGSLVHDALYQLMREGLINSSHRPVADMLLYDLCREDEMSWWRSQYVLWAVKKFALRAAERRDRVKHYAGLDRNVG
jgi:hypothetical protein